MRKRVAQHNLLKQNTRPKVVLLKRLERVADHAVVKAIEVSPQRIAEHLSRKILEELIFAIQQHLFEFRGAGEFFSTGEFARSIDRLASDFSPPTADGVEVFQAKAERVHAIVARSTLGILAVLF